jgi:hypothetical protein
MAQFPVLAYKLQVSTAPLPGAAVTFTPRVFIQVPDRAPFQLPVNSEAEFMAICALLQVPGRLVFEDGQGTLEKIMP